MNKPIKGPQNTDKRSNVVAAASSDEGVEKNDMTLMPTGTAIQTSISFRLVNPRKSFLSNADSAVVYPRRPRKPCFGV